MATRTFINGGVDNNWGTAGNWTGTAVPTSADDVVFDGSSPNCTVNTSARVALTLTFTGYTNTITMNQQITVSGNVTLVAAMGISGTSPLLVNATATLTSNGKTWPNAMTISGTITITLNDDLTVSGLLTLGGTTLTTTINGAFNINAAGGFTQGGTGSVVTGTATLRLTDTGTITGTNGAGALRLNLVIIAGAGTVTFAAVIFSYNTGTMTYTSGTVSVLAGATLSIALVTTLDTNPISWRAITISGASFTLTLTSNLTLTGLLTLGSTTNVIVLTGQTINASGGVRFGGTTSGNISGSAVINLTGTQTVDAPSATTGYVKSALTINAPGGTITFASVGTVFLIDIGQVLWTAGGVVTQAGTWTGRSVAFSRHARSIIYQQGRSVYGH